MIAASVSGGHGDRRRDRVEAARALVERVLGAQPRGVHVDLITGRAGESAFAVEASDDTVRIEATDAVSAASGLRHYLAHACGVQTVPDGPRPASLPSRWPDLDITRRTSPWRWRYHLNYCTFGYTTAYWDWPRWEQEIDAMALAGVNLPLAIVGFEGVWLRVLMEHGLSSERAREFLGAAAYLPWTWMGCVHDHGSPMTEGEIAERVELGRRIMGRQRELGMTPVLPGFTGYLPEELAGADARPVEWMGFRNHCVDPGDPRYREFGTALLGVQREMFGSDGFYAVDPFVEGRPPVDEPEEVAAYAGAVSDVLTAHDPESTWVLQAWPFSYRVDYWDAARTHAFLAAMPPRRSLVLDLWAEHDPIWPRADGFVGRPWVWTMLHSFGGRPGLHGALDVVATAADRARRGPAGESLAGVGTAMESLGSDPAVYELFADIVWSGAVDDLLDWLTERVRRRYGEEHRSLVAAWAEIARICYRNGKQSGPPVSVVMSRPRVVDDLSPEPVLNLTASFGSAAELRTLASAWGALLASALARGTTPGLDRDLVEVGLDGLARLAGVLQRRAVAEFQAGDPTALQQTASAFLDVLASMDRLAATQAEFRLGGWIDRARTAGRTPARADELEQDAKRLLTCWVAPGHQLQDYAGRHWAGLIATYYLPRWRLWFDTLLASLESGHLDVGSFDRALLRHEQHWLESPLPAPAPTVEHEPTAAAAEAARELLRNQLGREYAAESGI